MKKISGLLLSLGLSVAAPAQPARVSDEAVAWSPVVDAKFVANRPERIAWHREARFGLFIHYGIDCVAKLHYPGDAWMGNPVPAEEYHRYWTEFPAPKCDPDAWVKTAKEAGAKYICFVAKHHSGFCMWDSAYTDYKITTHTGRDIVAELAKACEKYGVELCLYYSIADWHHPDSNYMNGGPAYRLPPGVAPDFERYVAYMKAQLKELTSRYGRIRMIWFDGGWEKPWTRARATDLYDYTLGLQPGIICNDRVGAHSYRLTNDLGDYYTPENFVAKFDRSTHWEAALKLTDSWHWSPSDTRVKSLRETLRLLCETAGSDGNLLLNVGPHVDGYIVPGQAARLREVGAWLAVNGEAIYGTRGGPYLPTKELVATCSGKKIYLHLFTRPASGKLILPALAATPESAALLGGGTLPVIKEGHKFIIDISTLPAGDTIPVVRLTLDREALPLPLVATGETLDPNVRISPVTEANIK